MSKPDPKDGRFGNDLPYDDVFDADGELVKPESAFTEQELKAIMGRD